MSKGDNIWTVIAQKIENKILPGTLCSYVADKRHSVKSELLKDVEHSDVNNDNAVMIVQNSDINNDNDVNKVAEIRQVPDKCVKCEMTVSENKLLKQEISDLKNELNFEKLRNVEQADNGIK